jgi:hypothetical protein
LPNSSELLSVNKAMTSADDPTITVYWAGGFLVTVPTMETTMAGVFAAGDVRSGSTKQLGSAVGEGIAALLMTRRYLEAKNLKAVALVALGCPKYWLRARHNDAHIVCSNVDGPQIFGVMRSVESQGDCALADV